MKDFQGDLSIIRNFYDRRARDLLTDLERVDSSERSQRARFDSFARANILFERSVLDVGCGVGDLYQHLRNEGCKYTGVDLSEAMVARAREKYVDGVFNVANVLEWPDAQQRVDYAVAMSICSVKVPHADELLEELMWKLFDMSREAAHFSLLSAGGVQVAQEHVRVWNPSDVFRAARSITPWAVLRHDYLPHDFSITLYREQRSGR